MLFRSDNPPDYIACAGAPEVIELPSNTGSSSDTAGHTYHAEGARVNQNDSSIQEHHGFSTGASETEVIVQSVDVTTEENGIPIDIFPAELFTRVNFLLYCTTPGNRNRYNRDIRMYVVRVVVMSVCEPACSVL